MVPFVALLSIFFSCHFLEAGPQNIANSHKHGSASLADGAAHPELIPDSVAYRLFFATVARGPNPTDEEQKLQRLQLSRIRLEEKDFRELVDVLVGFRVRFDEIVNRYNQSAAEGEARNQSSDIGVLLKHLDALVESTRYALKVRLTPEGMSRFDAFVRSEKRQMKMAGKRQ